MKPITTKISDYAQIRGEQISFRFVIFSSFRSKVFNLYIKKSINAQVES